MPPIYSKEWKTAVVSMQGLMRQNRTSPCEAACPAGNNIQKMHSLLAEGRVDDALLAMYAKNPFPGVTGRVCPTPARKNATAAGMTKVWPFMLWNGTRPIMDVHLY